MKTNYHAARTATAMQQQAEALKTTGPQAGKYVLCGKLRIDRDAAVGYLKTGRIAEREAWFDTLPDRHDFGSVYALREAFRQFNRRR